MSVIHDDQNWLAGGEPGGQSVQAVENTKDVGLFWAG